MFSFDVDAGEMHLLDEIGPAWAGMIGIDQVAEGLKAMGGKDFTLYLSSPGGSVDEGTAIYNAIKRYAGKVTMVVDSVAASMGSYILQAADERIVASNSKVMVHSPWSIAIGSADDFRKEAEVLDKYRDAMVPGYAEATGKTSEEIRAIMDAETWYVGQEIVDAGFADKMVGKAKGLIDMTKLGRWAKKVPETVKEEARTMAQMSKFMSRTELKALQAKIKAS